MGRFSLLPRVGGRIGSCDVSENVLCTNGAVRVPESRVQLHNALSQFALSRPLFYSISLVLFLPWNLFPNKILAKTHFHHSLFSRDTRLREVYFQMSHLH